MLKSGVASQIIYKWQKLNQHRPPHLANRGHNNNPTRSYAAAASAPKNHNSRAIHPRPAARPGEIAQGPPGHITSHQPTTHLDPHRNNDVDWSSREPLNAHTDPQPIATLSNTGPRTAHADDDTIMQDDSTNAAQTGIDSSTPTNVHTGQRNDPHTGNENQQLPLPNNTTNLSVHPSADISVTQIKTQGLPKTGTRLAAHQQGSQPDDETQSNITKPTTAGVRGNDPQTQNLARTDTTAPVQRNTKPNISHPTPSRSGENIAQWQQVKRPRTKQSSATTKVLSTPSTSTQFKRSGSRNQGQIATNKFAPLEYEVHPTYEDDTTPPITVKITARSRRAPRRKYKSTQRAWSKETSEATNHPQQLRHPAQTLSHISPHQTQVILKSNNEKANPLREKLLHQIALIRAARSNPTAKQILLDKHADDAFLHQVQTRVMECHDTPQCTTETPIDLPLRAILEQDETRLRSALCFARMDLITRAALPAIYDVWPEQPSWHGTPLPWLPAQDSEVPCLQDASLAALADCPSLQNVWAHMMKEAPDIEATIRTAANQWRLFRTTQPTHRVDNAPTNTSPQ